VRRGGLRRVLRLERERRHRRAPYALARKDVRSLWILCNTWVSR
jgi:hypothetical protein